MALSKEQEQKYLKMVREDGLDLEYIEEQTPEICLEAVRQNWKALKFVQHQTTKICLEAVKQNGRAIWDVKNKTEELCLAAFHNSLGSYHYINDRTEEMDRMYSILKDFPQASMIKSYRHFRFLISSGQIEPKYSLYHVLEQLYVY